MDNKVPADYKMEFERYLMEFLPEPHDFNVLGDGWNITVIMFDGEGDEYKVKPDIKWKSSSDLKAMAKRIVRKYMASDGKI